MITGKIDRNLEAKIKLQVVNQDRFEEVEFLVDTGFNGFVAVPFSLVQRLKLELGAVQSGVTADAGRDTSILWRSSSIGMALPNVCRHKYWMSRSLDRDC